ncbi:MAG: CRISPR-associated helicase Cas3' [Caldilinea sp.]|nr:CRISPR-associated helicase Cas3' [Caldilinea sp.]
MTRPSYWPDWLEDVWAKSPEKGAGGAPESLAQHTWYVLERLADLIRLRPGLPEALGAPRLWHILFWSVMIHDFGKAATGFQARLRGGERWPHRHEVLSLAFMDWIAGGFSQDEQMWVAAAVASHHRDARDIQEAYAQPDDLEGDQLVELVAQLPKKSIAGMWRWLSECSTNWIASLELDKAGVMPLRLPEISEATMSVTDKGAQRIYHWLKVYRQLIKKLEKSNDSALIIGTLALRGHIINADQSGSAHAGAPPRTTFDADFVLNSQGIDRTRLFSHQQEAGAILGSAILVAPTGSGKTEAAQLWAARQAGEGALTRLFYTLPYQASMNAMKLRLEESYGEQHVGIQHGRSLLALYRFMLEKDYDPKRAAREARWSRNLAKLNYQPVRVFSPYQMLKGMYQLKGYEALLIDYHGAAFIFDEIHAYEVKRLAMILKTIEYLRTHYNARFLVMSATFPSLIRQWLRDALGSPAEIVASPNVFASFKRHRLHLLNGELTDFINLQRICRDAQNGKSVLVVCNIVARSQQVYDFLSGVLEPQGIQVLLLHGRFNVRDRLSKEQIVRDAVGSKSGQRRPIVLVATQAVEVSLDIDLDTIYTDPAPLEPLVQRFGRINRRRLQRNLAPVHVFCGPNDGQGIYDEELVERTLAILDRENGRPIDEGAIGQWLDEIYSDEIALRWQTEFDAATQEFEATCVRRLRAFQSDPLLEELFYRAFDSIEVLPNDLYDEFLQLQETDPIRTNELLVPISWRSYHILANRGQVKRGDRCMPSVVMTTYNSERGLSFDAQNNYD